MTNVHFETIDDYRDIETLNHYREAIEDLDLDPGTVLAGVHAKGRDNARTPMQWDATQHAGFTEGTPWLMVNPNFTDINVEADRASERSVFRFYQRLIQLRHEDSVVAHGDFTMLAPEDRQLFAFTRTRDDVTLVVVANVADTPYTEALPVDVSGAELILGNYPDTDAAELRPWEARLYRL